MLHTRQLQRVHRVESLFDQFLHVIGRDPVLFESRMRSRGVLGDGEGGGLEVHRLRRLGTFVFDHMAVCLHFDYYSAKLIL